MLCQRHCHFAKINAVHGVARRKGLHAFHESIEFRHPGFPRGTDNARTMCQIHQHGGRVRNHWQINPCHTAQGFCIRIDMNHELLRLWGCRKAVMQCSHITKPCAKSQDQVSLRQLFFEILRTAKAQMPGIKCRCIVKNILALP